MHGIQGSFDEQSRWDRDARDPPPKQLMHPCHPCFMYTDPSQPHKAPGGLSEGKMSA